MSRKQVLLIVEGIKQEIKLFQALFRCYGLDIGYEIVSYNTNIYELYERMFSDGFQDDLSLLGVLKERASEEDKWLFDQDYSDVLLVFDYELQDNRFSPARLEECNVTLTRAQTMASSTLIIPWLRHVSIF